jgi:hypothetical protein
MPGRTSEPRVPHGSPTLSGGSPLGMSPIEVTAISPAQLRPRPRRVQSSAPGKRGPNLGPSTMIVIVPSPTARPMTFQLPGCARAWHAARKGLPLPVAASTRAGICEVTIRIAAATVNAVTTGWLMR